MIAIYQCENIEQSASRLEHPINGSGAGYSMLDVKCWILVVIQ